MIRHQSTDFEDRNSRERMIRRVGGIARSRSTWSAARLTIRNPQSEVRNGITLVEILISMFVLLFGLMGVAAIFPVASHYVVEGEKKDRGSGLAQIAFEELKARKILQPKYWLYAPNDPNNPPTFLVNPLTGLFSLAAPNAFNVGWAFVLDPLGAMAAGDITDRDLFPFDAINLPNPRNPWGAVFTALNPSLGPQVNRFPVRRLTLPVGSNILNGETAETIFRLRDDLAVEQPDAGDRPSIQRWRMGTDAGNNPMALARDYVGDYTWLATVVPTRQSALLGLAPANGLYDQFYEVSTVVFYKRDTVPSATMPGSPGSERLVSGEFLNSNELAIYSPTTNVTDGADEVDAAVDKIRPGNWVAVMGVNQVTGVFMLKWYKVLSLDEDSDVFDENAYPNIDGKAGRYVMVQGPDWPASSNANLGVAILPGVIDVYTRVMQVIVE